MNHSQNKDSLESVAKELRRMRLVFGITLIIISLILAVVLPSVIRNAVFRVSHHPETKGLLMQVVEIVRGKPDQVESPEAALEAEAE
jgi:hypothetical protein